MVENKTAAQEIVKVEPAASSLTISGDFDPKFAARYSRQLVAAVRPTEADLKACVGDLPKDYQSKAWSILEVLSPYKPGMYVEDARPMLTELKIYQGTGNDPNLPENVKKGDLYLSTKQNLGTSFSGNVLVLWEGRALWSKNEDGSASKGPICMSMDRKMGNRFGDCKQCMHGPEWKEGQPSACRPTTSACMLSEDLSELVIVRFQNTSQPTGKQLKNFVTRSKAPWLRYYELGTEKQVSKTDKNRAWMTFKVSPKESLPPDTLNKFFLMLSKFLETDVLLPSIHNIYRQAAESNNIQPEGTPVAPVTEVPAGSATANYADFDDV